MVNTIKKIRTRTTETLHVSLWIGCRWMSLLCFNLFCCFSLFAIFLMASLQRLQFSRSVLSPSACGWSGGPEESCVNHVSVKKTSPLPLRDICVCFEDISQGQGQTGKGRTARYGSLNSPLVIPGERCSRSCRRLLVSREAGRVG